MGWNYCWNAMVLKFGLVWPWFWSCFQVIEFDWNVSNDYQFLTVFFKQTFFPFFQTFFLIEKIMRWTCDESLVKVSLKLSVGIWKFHWNFPSQLKVSMTISYMKIMWNFHFFKEIFMKLFCLVESFIETFTCRGKFQWKFQWNFHMNHMPTESFNETFTKFSSNVHLIIFSTKNVLKNVCL
jgi:hypothetical protein